MAEDEQLAQELRLAHLLEVTTRLAAGDLQSRALPSGAGDALDATIVAFNQVAETLATARAALQEAQEQGESRLQEQMAPLLLAQHSLAQQRQVLTSILNSIGEGVIACDEQGHFLFFNPAAESILGLGLTDATPEQWPETYGIYYPDGRTLFRAHELPLARALQGEFSSQVEMVIRNPLLPAEITISATGRPLRDDDGMVRGGVVVFRDITARGRAATELQRAHNQLAATNLELQNLNLQLLLLAELSQLLQICNTMQEVYSIIDMKVRRLFPADRGAVFTHSVGGHDLELAVEWNEAPTPLYSRVFAPEACWALRRGQVHLVRSHAAGLYCHHLAAEPVGGYMCIPLTARGETFGLLHLQFALPEANGGDERWWENRERLAILVAEHLALGIGNLKLRETLHLQSIRDPLTGLFNRRYLEKTLEHELQRSARNGQALCLLMIDLDHFKHFNDRFGHDAGDTLLREVGAFLQRQTRSSDVACRYGGEEFTLLLTETLGTAVQKRAEQMRRDVQQLAIQHRGQGLGPVTFSVGCAVYPDDGATGEHLLRAADRALYRAKARGRDCVVMAGSQGTLERAVGEADSPTP
jgi:diguanylate cyclase (GGDEF)-like protein/PAS domain S-box-containing protein